MGLSTGLAYSMTVAFTQSKGTRESKSRHTRQDSHSFNDLNSELSANHICDNLVTERSQQVQPALKGTRRHQGMNIRRQ